MNNKLKKFFGSKVFKSKTVWTAAAAIVGAGAAYAEGGMTGQQAGSLAATGLISIFLRLALAKIENQLFQDSNSAIEEKPEKISSVYVK